MRKLVSALCVVAGIASPAVAAEPQRVLSSIAVDFDGDGKMDKADLVLVNPSGPDGAMNGGSDYMLSDTERVDLALTFNAGSGKAPVIRKNIVDTTYVLIVSALESKSAGSISLRSCYGCGANKSWDQTLTIAYRGGEFVIAGYSKAWDWNVHTADDTVETMVGECDINYLTGKGTATYTWRPAKPLKRHFRPIRLADWNSERIPKECEFY